MLDVLGNPIAVQLDLQCAEANQERSKRSGEEYYHLFFFLRLFVT